MFFGPLFRRELRAASSKRRVFLFRASFTIVLAAVATVIGLVVYSAASRDDTETRVLYFGRALFLATLGIQLLFLVFFVPSQAASAIAGEREKDTLLLLLLTRLRPLEIVLTKATARWLASLDVILIGLPVLVISASLGGLRNQLGWTVLVLLSSVAFMTTLSILASARHEHVVQARGQAVGLSFAWLALIPLVSILPFRTGTIWGDLLVELRRFCGLVAPSSPISLLTDHAWYVSPRVQSLEGRVALMIGLQALFGLPAILAAAAGLRVRERSPNWTDPTRGHRPRCGDDPIYWREFELPMRRGAGPMLLIRLRLVGILVWALLMNVLYLVGNLLALAVPIGLLLATLYLGFAAFQERWQAGQAEPYLARVRFNYLIRIATGLLALFPSANVCPTVAARIMTDRDKRAWEVFLTTPLTAREILRSKARAALHGLRETAWPLPVFWALGLACGVVTLPGVALTAIDVLLIVWAAVAIGLFLGVRPGTAASVASQSAWVPLACLVLHAPLLAALLVSPWELARFTAMQDRPLQAVAVLAGLAVLILTATVAWWATRRMIDRFDEWVGRPIRGDRTRASWAKDAGNRGTGVESPGITS